MDLFGHKKTIDVPLTFDVMLKCKCIVCPVQANSECSKPKIKARMELLKNAEMAKNQDPEMMKHMNPEDMKNMTPDFTKNEAFMKNMEMLRNINPVQMMLMSEEERKKMGDEMAKAMPKEQLESMKPKTEDMPGPYCAYGVAACKDLDFSKMCICPQCQIYKDYSLMKAKPTLYFCNDGKAT